MSQFILVGEHEATEPSQALCPRVNQVNQVITLNRADALHLAKLFTPNTG
jgi:hypothetical protein